ncbi:MAG: synthase gamma subunit [Thermomicrobiales bacterium]|jgi:F-type H+-transporting ATPase subunit gamma|nr:synthase gamma subunit [Thermomicrobiales bacterium]MDF3040453.1 synthase gamma subunit [Thermomicrobiales bacterium]
MANTREIRRRIRSVGNMQQITRAMEMVSAAKMRKAQQRVTASRPYSDQLRQIMSDLATQQPDPEQLAQFPLLQKRPVQNVLLIVATPDRGLTGALNTNILRRASRYILEEAGAAVQVIAAGKKARDYLVRTRQNVVAEFIGLGENLTLDEVRPIADIAIDDFVEGRVDAVFVVYSRFVNTLIQRPELMQILPVEPPPAHEGYSDYIFEPSPEEVLNNLLPRYVEVQLYQAILEGLASEHSARMVAMRSASDNAKEIQQELTLSYNKARQAQITREVSEIAAGANAMAS